MSQIVSRNIKGDTYSHSKATQGIRGWKQTLQVAFHGAVASTYGYAICWQNVSEASALLYARTNPLMRYYGKWRFLTYHCLVIQFVAYSLCLTSHFVPRLRRPRDFFFTTFAFPVGVLVVSSFWAIWFTCGREFIHPISVEPFYPNWLNHITHSIIAPINFLELLLVKKQYSSDKKSLIPLAGYTLSYTSFLLYIRYQTGRFVYPFLNQMDAIPVGAFIVGMTVFIAITYKSGKFLHDIVHRCNTIKSKLVIKSSSSSSSSSSSKKKN